MLYENSMKYVKVEWPEIVLILILMEYALWVSNDRRQKINWGVLILILMEYALWGNTAYCVTVPAGMS